MPTPSNSLGNPGGVFSEGPGPITNTLTEVIWDHKEPLYAVVVPNSREFDMEGPQGLVAYMGEVLGRNIKIVRVGSMVLGYRFSEYLLWGCMPPPGSPDLMDQAQSREWYWWHHEFACRFRGGLRH